MKILAFSVARPWEFVAPLRTVGSNAVVVSPEPSDGIVQTFLHVVRQGVIEFRRFDPDVLVVDGLDVIGLLAMSFSLWYRVPLVVRLGGNPWLVRREQIQGLRIENAHRLTIASIRVRTLFDRVVLWFVDGCIVVSKSLENEVLERTDIPPERTAVVHYPPKNDWRNTNESNASSKTEGTLTDEETIILTVTNLRFRGKFEGVCRIVRDIEEILLRHDDAAYVVAGDGPYHEKLETFIDDRVTDPRVKERIYTPGFVSDIGELYAKATIVAYVSFIDAYPNVVLEAQMAGLPVVANAAHGIVEQIEDGETGLLIDISETDDLRDAIMHLLRYPEERRRLGRNARRTVREKNSPEHIGTKLLESLSKMYGCSGSASFEEG